MIPTIQPSAKQDLAYRMLANDFTSYLLFGGGAGGGKSWFGCEWLLTNCYRYPGTRWFIGRKERSRLYNTTFVTWKKVCAFHKIPQSDWVLNQQLNYIEFVAGDAKGSRIDLIDLAYQPSDPDYQRFGSLECTGGWIEEGGEVDFLAYDVLKTRIGRQMNVEYGLVPAKMLITCNPTQNWLYRIFYKPWKKGLLPRNLAFIQSLYKDNPYTRDVYEVQLNSITDDTMRARLRDGKWEYTDDDLKLMSYDAICDLFINQVELDITGYFSGDIARKGADKIVLAAWKGFNLYRLDTKSKQSTVTTEQDIRDILIGEKISMTKAIVDEDGIGGGVVDHLTGVHGFMGGRSPILKADEEIEDRQAIQNLPDSYFKKPNFKNLRTQCYFLLADKVNFRQMAITAPLTDLQREQIIEELEQIKKVDTAPDAPLQIVPKDEIKMQIGRSPDYADTLMMRMYFELIVPEKPKGKFNAPNMDAIRAAGKESPYGGIPLTPQSEFAPGWRR